MVLPPLRQSVHTTVMYIMYLFQVLQEDLCSFVLNQKKKLNLCVVTCVHLRHSFFFSVLFCFFVVAILKKKYT